MHQALLTFNAGEVSPYLRHRIDFDKTGSAAETLDNFLAMPYGGVIKRPGLEYVNAVQPAGTNSRLLPFVASDGSRYLLHFTVDALTVYDPAGTVKASLPYLDGHAWPDPFDWSDSLRDVQAVQLNDIAYIAHPACAPMRLARLSDTSWTLEYLAFPAAPTLDENTDPTALFAIAGNPIAGTWASGASYTVGDYVYTDSEWECIYNHTASGSNSPGGGGAWRGFWKRRLFAAGEAVTLIAAARSEIAWTLNNHVYAAGDIATDGADNAICIAGHTANLFAPEDPATTQEWALVPLYDPTHGTAYAVNMHREFAGDIYVCLLSHLSDAAVTEPTVGADWLDYWELVRDAPATFPDWFLSDAFPAATRRSNLGIVYIADSGHIPVAANEPGVGASWTTYWRRVYSFTATDTLTDSGPGTYYRIAPERGAGDDQIELVAGGASYSPLIVVDGPWNFFTYGIWRGTYYLQRSLDGGTTWTTARTYQAADDRNVADTGTEEVPTLMRILFSATNGSQTVETPDVTGRAILIPQLPYVTGYALMTERASDTELRGVAVSPVLSGSAWRWAEGAFSTDRGFPRAIALHDSRLIFAGTAANPVSLWASRTDDFTNFEPGTAATHGLFQTLALTNASPIRWLASQRRLLVGTSLGEWVVGSETSDAAMSPANFMARQHSGYGSAQIPPLIANDALFFCERKGTRLREFGFVNERGAYDAADLSRIAEHLTSPGLAAFAWQQTREPGLWVVRRDGTLLHFAYARAENLAAWSRHTTTAGLFRDVAILPSDEGDDEIFFIIDRGEDSTLERFPQHWQSAQETGSGWFHLDGLRGTGDTFAPPAWLEAAAAARVFLLNGTVTDEATYSGPLQPADVWQVGLPILSRLIGLPVDTATQDGTTQARKKRCHKIILSLYQSRGGYLHNVAETRKQPIPNTRPETLLRTGWEETIPDSGSLDDLQLRLTHAEPFPFCLRAAVIRWALQEA